MSNVNQKQFHNDGAQRSNGYYQLNLLSACAVHMVHKVDFWISISQQLLLFRFSTGLLRPPVSGPTYKKFSYQRFYYPSLDFCLLSFREYIIYCSFHCILWYLPHVDCNYLLLDSLLWVPITYLIQILQLISQHHHTVKDSDYELSIELKC